MCHGLLGAYEGLKGLHPFSLSSIALLSLLGAYEGLKGISKKRRSLSISCLLGAYEGLKAAFGSNSTRKSISVY